MENLNDKLETQLKMMIKEQEFLQENGLIKTVRIPKWGGYITEFTAHIDDIKELRINRALSGKETNVQDVVLFREWLVKLGLEKKRAYIDDYGYHQDDSYVYARKSTQEEIKTHLESKECADETYEMFDKYFTIDDRGRIWSIETLEKEKTMISALEMVKAVTGIVLLIAAGIGMYTVASWLF